MIPLMVSMRQIGWTCVFCWLPSFGKTKLALSLRWEKFATLALGHTASTSHQVEYEYRLVLKRQKHECVYDAEINAAVAVMGPRCGPAIDTSSHDCFHFITLSENYVDVYKRCWQTRQIPITSPFTSSSCHISFHSTELHTHSYFQATWKLIFKHLWCKLSNPLRTLACLWVEIGTPRTCRSTRTASANGAMVSVAGLATVGRVSVTDSL